MVDIDVDFNKKINKNGFPKLMRIKKEYDNKGAIVLFIEEDKGTVVYCSNQNSIDILKIGKYYESWNMYHFEDFDGSVTISNSV